MAASSVPCLPSIDVYYQFTEIHPIMSRDDFYKVHDDIIATYESVPYHSRFHGSDVMVVGYRLLKHSNVIQYLNRYEVLTFLFGMLGHDSAHPGLSNKTNIETIRARFPKAKSPLEEYHYSQTSAILKKHHIGHYDDFLRQIILATDPFLPVETAQIGLVDNIKGIVPIIKLADVNHTVSSFDKHLEWTWKLESELGFKLTPVNQIKFLEAHLIPLIISLEGVLNVDIYQDCIWNLRQNIEFWKGKL